MFLYSVELVTKSYFMCIEKDKWIWHKRACQCKISQTWSSKKSFKN